MGDQSSNAQDVSELAKLIAIGQELPRVIDEQECIERAAQGDLDAFNQLVLHYQGLVYSIAYRMLQDGDAAADAVQEGFIKAFRALHTFQGGSFRGWLVRIVVNTCYDVLRSRQRRPTDSLDDLAVEQEFSPQLIDPAEGLHAYIERGELGDLIEAAICTLPEDQRLVLVLCDVHGYSYDEIATTAQLPIGTVKSRISRARAKLRDFLLKQPELLPAPYRHKSR